MEKLTKRDWTLIAICIAIFAISLAISLNWFSRAFPEASIDFKYDRAASAKIAERVLAAEHISVASLRHSAVFDADDQAKTFLERTLGLARASAIMRRDVHLWYWHHRWFRPLQEEEYSVDVAPTGEIVSFGHRIPEARAIATPDIETARTIAEAFMARNGITGPQTADGRPQTIDPLQQANGTLSAIRGPRSAVQDSLRLVAQSERNLPHRVQRIFTWESKSIRPAGAPYRYEVTVDGNVVTGFVQQLRVPDEWKRSYGELRSKNELAGNVDTVFLIITMIAALGVFIVRMRRGDIRVRFLLAVGIVSIVLVTGVSLNSYPSALASYDTTVSYPAFLAQFALRSLLGALGTAMLLIVLSGAGEVLYRERAPHHLAISKIWTPGALGSKRVFRSFVVGYTLVAFFLAYQVVFYLVADRFGAWAPADIPYDDILNSALPWVAVLFAGFFPAMSEEFMSRAFSIPFFNRVLKSRVAAIVVAGFIWGFGHATYPNQPFYIRGVEVGLAGVMIGFLFDAFGLLPLLIWHYTVDAFYTAMLLFRSGNAYYVASAAASSFIFVVPMLISIALYLKRGGFAPDDALTNATMPVAPLKERAQPPAVVELPAARPATRRQVVTCAVVIAVAVALMATNPPSPQDAIDYRITKAQAKEIAAKHLQTVETADRGARTAGQFSRVIATALDGFRNWDPQSGREDGGGPGGFDGTAAEYMLRSGLSMDGLVNVFRSKIQAGTWTVRFFTPMKKEEMFVEIDPRTSRALGRHLYQSETNPGPRLEQAQAQPIAMAALRTYGFDPAAFDLKEALSFQQPNRRDWLFHFQERAPIVAAAFRRVSVRVAGNEVTQVTTTVKVPDAVYREASQQTLRNIVLMILRIAGALTGLTLLVTGFVVAAARRRPDWRRALRWTLALAIVPILNAAAGYEDALFGYRTAVRWDTFFAGLAVDVFRSVGLRLGILFLAVAAIDAAFPWAFALLSREGRARFGRSALASALTALGIVAAFRVITQLAANRFPSMANVSIDVPNAVAIAFPAVLAIADALFNTIIGSAVIASFAVSFGMIRREWLRHAFLIGVVVCAAVDPSATAAQTPLMLARAIVLAVAVWAVVRYVLGGNLLSWPVAFFTGAMLNGIVSMAGNHRPDLYANAAAVAVVLVAAIIWLVIPRPDSTPDPEFAIRTSE